MTDTPHTDPETLDELYRQLSHRRRRFVLRQLAAQPSPLTVGRLAAEITAWERERNDDADLDEVALSLRHVHLPSLAGANLISYSRTDGTVTPSGDERTARSLAHAGRVARSLDRHADVRP